MARRRRRKARKNPFGKRRRRARRANPRRRRRARRARQNPFRRRRRARRNPHSRRRRRRNPSEFAIFTPGGSPAQDLASRRDAGLPTRPRRRRKLSLKRRRAKAKRLNRKSTKLARRARRLRSAARVLRSRRAPKKAVIRAMHLKTNPSFGGIVSTLKVLAPQGAVATVAAGGLALAGQAIGAHLSAHLPPSVQPYVPSVLTLALTGAAWKIADKVAPKYKGAVAIGGILAAILQGIAASPLGVSGPIADAKRALGLGDYTMIGQRAYAEAGIFRNIGDYTMIGTGADNATEFARTGDYTMIGTGADNATEFARDSLRGADDNTEFAPGEGGLLNGGMFRGPSSR